MPNEPRPVIYLDHAASAPMCADALEAMTAALARSGNPSSLHGSGRATRRVLEEARESVARALGARPSEVVFTSGGTESDNLAVKGIFWARRGQDPTRTRIVISAVEHHAVIDPAQWLAEAQGAELVVLPVDAEGFVRVDDLREELAVHADSTALVSIMWANNEVGSIEPIAELAAVCAEFGVPMHSDAVQAAGHVPVDFAASGLSAMSVAAHKFGGPRGVGALVIGRKVGCVAVSHGGGQERDLRSGTQDVPGAVGMAVALRNAVTEMVETTEHVEGLRTRLLAHLSSVAGCLLNSPSARPHLAGTVHVSFVGCEGDSLLMLLDAKGIECSTGSACTAGVARVSHVLAAMGQDGDSARGSLRFSFGKSTTVADIDAVGKVIGEVVERARTAGLVSTTRDSIRFASTSVTPVGER